MDPEPSRGAVEVVRLTDGAVEQVIDLPYAPSPPTSSDRDAYFRALQTELGINDDAIARQRTSTTFAELRPAAAALLVDDADRLWVAEHDPSAFRRKYIGARWDVIDLARERTMHICFPERFRLMAIRGTTAYGVTTLENGVHVVDTYRLNRDDD